MLGEIGTTSTQARTASRTGGPRTLLRVAPAAVMALVLAAGATACDATGAEQTRAAAGPSGSTGASPGGGPAAGLTVDISHPDGGSAVPPTAPVTVTVSGGALRTVTLTGPKGVVVPGAADPAGTTWTSSGALAYATRYTTRAVAVDPAGKETVRTSTFTTAAPKKLVKTSISPLTGTEVGVGMPIVVKLSTPVADRAAVVRALTVSTSRPVEGAWRWIDTSEVHYRPRTYWPANTDVTLGVKLLGVDLGGGAWGAKDRQVRFRVGASTISTVDVRKLRMTVVRDGKVVRTIPVTTGKAGFLTRGGIKVVSEKHPMKVMDAATINIRPGEREYYRLNVPYALRVTWSGEFVHGAPWSVGNQGRANVSHGCVGMSMANARWFYGLTKVGDVINVVGSTRVLEPNNGWTDWNVSWASWSAGSAGG